MRTVRVVVVSAVIAVAGAAPQAVAQSRSCLPLQMELAALDNPNSSVESIRPDLRRELNRARAEAERAGCRTRLFSRGKKGCRPLLDRVTRLKRELSRSGSNNIFSFGRTPEDRQRRRLLRALSRAGCSLRANTYRTICVRVCDGYYFPLSFAASRQRFASDAAKCTSQYEQGEAALFYYPNPGGEVGQAMSLSGERYFDQPYAFLYRSSFQRQCAVRLHQGLASLSERVQVNPSTPGEIFEAAVDARMARPSVPVPIRRVNSSADPETTANRAGKFVPEKIGPPTPAIAAAKGDKTPRTVGEEYYFSDANPGPPAFVAGYEPPVPRDFLAPQNSTSQPVAR